MRTRPVDSETSHLFSASPSACLTCSCCSRGVSAAADPPFPAADAGGPRLLRGSQLRVHEASDQTPKTLRHHQRSVWRSGHRERVPKQGPLDVSGGQSVSPPFQPSPACLGAFQLFRLFFWCLLRGKSPISVFLLNKKKELEKLRQMEATLDGLIRRCAQQLFDLTDDDRHSAYPCCPSSSLEAAGKQQVFFNAPSRGPT